MLESLFNTTYIQDQVSFFFLAFVISEMWRLSGLFKATELHEGKFQRTTRFFLEKGIECEWYEGQNEAIFSRKSQILSTNDIKFVYGESF